MEKQKIFTTSAPHRMDDHVHPFAQGWKVGDLIFTGGIAAEDPATGEMVPGDIQDQARRCFETMKAILAEAGTSMHNVVKVTVFFIDYEDKQKFESVYGEYFPDDKSEYEIVVAESSYDYMSGDKKLATLMKVGTIPGYGNG